MGEDLTYEEKSKSIMDKQVKRLCSKEIAMVKVVWQNHTGEEATREYESKVSPLVSRLSLVFKLSKI